MMNVAVSIVTYHTDCDELRRCLASLSSPVVSRVYVVDNARDMTVEALCGRYPVVEYMANDNVGYGAGHNVALRKSIESGVRYHLVLNSDVEFPPESVEIAVRYMEQNENVALLHPRIVDSTGALQYTSRMLPTPWNVFARRFMPSFISRLSDERYLLKSMSHDAIFDAPYHQGSFMLLRVSALKRVGLFDERFFMYPEDIDLSRRLYRMYRTIYYPGITVVHHHHAASYHNSRMLWIHIVNMMKYFNKWGWFFDRERKEFNARLR